MLVRTVASLNPDTVEILYSRNLTFAFPWGVSLLFKVRQMNMAEGGRVQRLLERSNRQSFPDGGGRQT